MITGATIAGEVAEKEGLEGWKVGKASGEVIAGENSDRVELIREDHF